MQPPQDYSMLENTTFAYARLRLEHEKEGVISSIIVEYCNSAFSNILNRSVNTIMGQALQPIISDASYASFLKATETLTPKNPKSDFLFEEEINNRKLSFKVNLYLTTAEIIDVFIQDITDLTEAERKAEENSRMRHRQVILQGVILDISSSFIDFDPDNLDALINQSLKKIGESVQADRVYVFDYQFKKRLIQNTHEWCQTGISPQIDNLQAIPMDSVSDWVRAHMNKEAFYVPDVQALDEGDLRNILEPQEIKSTLAIPMMKADMCQGFVGFDSVRAKHVYSDTEKRLLMAFANILSNAFEKVKLEQKLKASQKMLRKVIDAIPVRVFWKDKNFQYLGCNRLFAQDGGLNEPNDILGMNDYELAWRDQASLYRQDDEIVMQSGKEKLNYEEPQTTPTGENIWLRTSKIPLKDQAGEVFGVLGTYEDITEEKALKDQLENSEAELRLENQRFTRLVESTADIIFELDTEGRHKAVYGEWLKEKGLSEADFIGKTSREILGDQASEVHEAAIKRALKGEKVIYEWQDDSNNHTIEYYQTSLSPIYEQDTIIGLVGIGRNMTDKHMYLEKIELLSRTDYLTGLYNRQYFEKKLKQFDTKRYFPLGITMIDVNGLKLLNDAFGHDTGDYALKKVASIIRKASPKDSVVARIGGDEFAVILPNTSMEESDALKNKILNDIKHITIKDITLSVSVGYEIKDRATTDIKSIFKSAEDFMYRRKLTEGKSIRNKTIQIILKTLTDKYKEEKIHSERVGRIAKSIGKTLGLNPDDLELLSLAGKVHDIGKISIPDVILDKPSALSEAEYETIKNHTINGYQILKSADEYSELAEYALTHHERYDGKGYPNQLKGKKIPLFSRILSVADAYEVMTSDRPYRNALPQAAAIAELKKYAGKQFDPEIVRLFIDKTLKIIP